MPRTFVHLHVHSEYSLLDGACRVKELAQRAAELGMASLAVTDHGVMYGAIDFYKACRDAGVKPIIGCEVYVAPRTRFDRQAKVDDDISHLVLLAEDMEGYRNLVRLVSFASLEGFYYKPRIDRELLAEHSRGLIALSACLGGEVAKRLLQGDGGAARAAAGRYLDIFGRDRFFLELQDHGLPEQAPVNRELLSLARELDIGVVATNDVHYLRREDAHAHDALICIQTGKTVADGNRMRYPGGQFYLKSGDEMEAVFGDCPDALANTLLIAERCRLEFAFDQVHLPHYDLPEGYDAGGYLHKLCGERLPGRYPDPVSPEVEQRLEYELSVIEKMGYPGYFLTVADFIGYARSQGIAVGPGRGSAAGSLVAYVLGITGIDPLRYGLLFERFLNPERVTMPDMDIDFDDRRRGEVIEYVRNRHGRDRVSQIITFGRMLARAVIRDVGRVLGMPYGEVDRIAKMVPAAPGMTLDKALDQSPELAEACQQSEDLRTLIDLARRLEGLPRHASVHAAGVVIARDPLVDHVPLQKMPDGTVVTQFPMNTLDELGLLKFDFLGLRTLSVIEEAARFAGAASGAGAPPVTGAPPAGGDLDPYNLPLEDPATYELLGQGHTAGIFQLESSGMREMLRDLKPTCLEDIIAAVSLYRPGPMENIPEFIRAKHGGGIRYPHPALEPILKETYGIMVYQEQIMRVASVMAGFTLGQADILRRAVGKKKKEALAAQREAFVKGCLAQGHPKKLATELYDLIVKFADYGFNKSHGAAYAYLAYITAYLKANHPVVFMAALLTSVKDSTDKVAEYIRECARMGIPVLPPDVNESQADFTAVGGRIRFGLEAVKNVGLGAVESIVRAREQDGPFASLVDFLVRVDGRLVNRRAVESLIKAGALDSLGGHRAQLLEVLDTAMQRAQDEQARRAGGQMSLFEAPAAGTGASAAGAPRPLVESLPLPDVPALPANQVLAMEKEVVGFYLSGHPLYGRERDLQAVCDAAIADLAGKTEGTRVTVGGLVLKLRKVSTRAGGSMAFVTVEDLSGMVEVVVFPRTLEQFRDLVREDAVVVVEGKVSWKDEEVTVVAEGLRPLESVSVAGAAGAAEEATAATPSKRTAAPAAPAMAAPSSVTPSMATPAGLVIRFVGDGDHFLLAGVKDLLRSHPGPVPVCLSQSGQTRAVRADRRFWVNAAPELLTKLELLVGPGNVHLLTSPGQMAIHKL